MEAITRATQVVNAAPRISRATFAMVLEIANSPAEDEAPACYDVLIQEGVDPLFALAIFQHESGFGLAGINLKYGTLNPGNCRTTRTGRGILIQTERGQFVKYPSWLDGFRDLARRLVDPSFDYALAGAVTIEQILYIFAPPKDNNNTEGYIKAVVNFMNDKQDIKEVEVESSKPMIDTFPVIDTSHHAKLPNYSPGGNSKRMLVIHVAEGGYAGSRDWLCRQLTQREIDNDGYSSCHYIVSENGSQVAQMLSDDDVAYHTGNGEYNRKAIGIEQAGFAAAAAKFMPEMLRTTARLAARLCKKYGIPADHYHIIGHAQVPLPNDHTDPGPNYNWGLFMQYVVEEMAVLNGQSPAPAFNPNPKGLDVGSGMLETLTRRQLTALTSEQYYQPEPGQPKGLAKRSFLWTEQGQMLVAIQDVSAQGDPLETWSVRVLSEV